MPLLYHAYVYLEFLILACTIYILAPLSIVVDTETGVNYLVHDTGITPLLDKNGTVVITEINK